MRKAGTPVYDMVFSGNVNVIVDRRKVSKVLDELTFNKLLVFHEGQAGLVVDTVSGKTVSTFPLFSQTACVFSNFLFQFIGSQEVLKRSVNSTCRLSSLNIKKKRTSAFTICCKEKNKIWIVGEKFFCTLCMKAPRGKI